VHVRAVIAFAFAFVCGSELSVADVNYMERAFCLWQGRCVTSTCRLQTDLLADFAINFEC